MKKIGLLFGSFNPIHNGHLVIANYMAQFTDLDVVWFVLSPQNPLKPREGLLADYHRLELIRIALENQKDLKVTDIEMKMPRPSYTVDTLTLLGEKYPDFQFVIICGADIFHDFRKWKNYKMILENYALYVYPRPGFDLGEFENHPNIKVFQTPLMDLSSSFIREGIISKKNMQFWMPEKVYSYILENHFYEK